MRSRCISLQTSQESFKPVQEAFPPEKQMIHTHTHYGLNLNKSEGYPDPRPQTLKGTIGFYTRLPFKGSLKGGFLKGLAQKLLL